MRPKYRFGEFQLDPASRELLRNGHPVPLRPKSLECIVYLVEHRDRAVGRDELISARERLDFTERLLSAREPVPLPAPERPGAQPPTPLAP